MQVVDSTEQVTGFQVSSDGGSSWTAAELLNDNFWTISSGTGSTSVTVKLTSASGSEITVPNVGISSGAAVTAPSNFPGGSSNAASGTTSNTGTGKLPAPVAARYPSHTHGSLMITNTV